SAGGSAALAWSLDGPATCLTAASIARLALEELLHGDTRGTASWPSCVAEVTGSRCAGGLPRREPGDHDPGVVRRSSQFGSFPQAVSLDLQTGVVQTGRNGSPGGSDRPGDRRGMGESGGQAGPAGDGRGVSASRVPGPAGANPQRPGGPG